jgi:hypothetical protein
LSDNVLKVLGTGRCACCAGKIGRVNLVSLRKKAAWPYPQHGNLITGEAGGAVAIVCDTCIEKDSAVITEAVEYRGGELRYHGLESLEDLPEVDRLLKKHPVTEGGAS